jgi:hypothetical protein
MMNLYYIYPRESSKRSCRINRPFVKIPRSPTKKNTIQRLPDWTEALYLGDYNTPDDFFDGGSVDFHIFTKDIHSLEQMNEFKCFCVKRFL